MTPALRVAIVGLGNVGWNLANRILETEHVLQSVVTTRTSDLGPEIQILSDPSRLTNIDLAIVCVTDDAVISTIEKIDTSIAVAHTSGSTPLTTSRPKSGVVYPFQTFTRGRKVAWNDIPVFIESNDPELESDLRRLATSLSDQVEYKDSEQRRSIHMSGVFAANFVNHILYQAELLAKKGGEDISVLHPLIGEVVLKAIESGPYDSQTGPARRGDLKLIQEHIQELARINPEGASIYDLISKSIQKTYRS